MKPFDVTKFKKEVQKKLGIKDGFYDPKIFISTGNFCLDYRISGRFFDGGVPLEGKVSVFSGESGSGKSYIISGNMVRWAMDHGIFVVLLDSESAIERSWLKALNVDPDNTDGIMRYPVSSPDDVAAMIDMFMNQYVADNDGVPEEEQQPVLFVIDSLGMLSTKTEQEQFAAGELKGDFGRKAKALKHLVTQMLRRFSGYKVGCIASNHSYKSQDMFNPDDVISGGAGFIYASSIVVAMNKLKLKEDEDGNKIADTRGIRSKCRVVKSRYSKPFEEVEIKIPYEGGMDPYSGLIEMFEKAGTLVKAGNKLEYIDKQGTSHKFFRKEWAKNHEMLTQIMREYDAEKTGNTGFGDDVDPDIVDEMDPDLVDAKVAEMMEE